MPKTRPTISTPPPPPHRSWRIAGPSPAPAAAPEARQSEAKQLMERLWAAIDGD
jgi:hypothetical protein